MEAVARERENEGKRQSSIAPISPRGEEGSRDAAGQTSHTSAHTWASLMYGLRLGRTAILSLDMLSWSITAIASSQVNG